MPDDGYCTVEDLRRALRDADLPGDASQDRDIAIDAITGQAEWLRETTHRHWFESGGLTEDTDNIVPTSARTHDNDEQDVPSTPHPQHSMMFVHDRGRYPRQTSGPYTHVRLQRRDVTSITKLLVRGADGSFEDWVADSDRVEGRGEDYYLQVDDSGGQSTLYLHAGSLPALQNYDNAVVATYEYGIDGLSDTVRRAVALRAAAQLLLDDEAALGIPENASFVSAESKVQAMERQAEELLEVHM